jgi:hypothetical protein
VDKVSVGELLAAVAGDKVAIEGWVPARAVLGCVENVVEDEDWEVAEAG